MKPQLRFNTRKCISCKECVKHCPNNCIDPFSGEKCTLCGQCVLHCPCGALEICGKEMTAEEVIRLVLRDQTFYQASGGGITLSGGEPLMQFDFCLALCRRAKEQGLDICIETSGHAPFERLESLAPFISYFLYDIKETDDALHQQFTGVSNVLILENLRKLNDSGANIILRCPIIPGCNDREEHFIQLGLLAQSLSGVSEVHLEPYHPLGIDKRAQLGMLPQRHFLLPQKHQIDHWLAAVQERTDKLVRLA